MACRRPYELSALRESERLVHVPSLGVGCASSQLLMT